MFWSLKNELDFNQRSFEPAEAALYFRSAAEQKAGVLP